MRMAVSWTKHRFSGGVLALDTANTVVLRGDRAQFLRPFRGSVRRLRVSPRRPRDFAAAELGGRALVVPRPEAWRRGCWRTGRRPTVCSAPPRGRRASRPRTASGFLRACAACLDGQRRAASAAAAYRSAIRRGRSRFEAALAVSALSLLAGDAWQEGSRSAPTAAGCFSTEAAIPAGSGATCRSAATATRRNATIDRRKAVLRGGCSMLERWRAGFVALARSW